MGGNRGKTEPWFGLSPLFGEIQNSSIKQTEGNDKEYYEWQII